MRRQFRKAYMAATEILASSDEEQGEAEEESLLHKLRFTPADSTTMAKPGGGGGGAQVHNNPLAAGPSRPLRRLRIPYQEYRMLC